MFHCGLGCLLLYFLILCSQHNVQKHIMLTCSEVPHVLDCGHNKHPMQTAAFSGSELVYISSTERSLSHEQLHILTHCPD